MIIFGQQLGFLQEKLTSLFMSVYAGDTPQSDDLYLTFEKSNITRFAAFVGLPNRRLSQDDVTQSWMNLAKNFIGWQNTDPIGLRFFKALFALPINTALIPFKLLLSLLKIGTELVPGALGNMAWILSRAGAHLVLDKMNEDWSTYDKNTGARHPFFLRFFLKTLRFLIASGVFVVSLCAIALKFSFWMGHCLTSPTQSLNEAWYEGLKISRLRGAVYVALTMITISWLYVITFPLAFKVIAATLVPLFLAHAPTAVLSALNTISALCSPWLTLYGHLVITLTNQSLIPVLSKILGSAAATMLSHVVASAPVAVGLGVTFGIVMGILPVIKDLLYFTLGSIAQGIVSVFSRLTSRAARTTEAPVVDASPGLPFIEPVVIEQNLPSPGLNPTRLSPVVAPAVLPVLLPPMVADPVESDSDSYLDGDEEDHVSILSSESRARFFTPALTDRSLNRTLSNASDSSWHSAIAVFSDGLEAHEVERTTP